MIKGKNFHTLPKKMSLLKIHCLQHRTPEQMVFVSFFIIHIGIFFVFPSSPVLFVN